MVGPSGPIWVVRLVSVGFTHGYSRCAPSGHSDALPDFAARLKSLPRVFDIL
jgi:hypothetical protein